VTYRQRGGATESCGHVWRGFAVGSDTGAPSTAAVNCRENGVGAPDGCAGFAGRFLRSDGATARKLIILRAVEHRIRPPPSARSADRIPMRNPGHLVKRRKSQQVAGCAGSPAGCSARSAGRGVAPDGPPCGAILEPLRPGATSTPMHHGVGERCGLGRPAGRPTLGYFRS
jgi:hypothetical protein